ncbi:hypothetical protein TWF281_002935 [Arthrobotrys megalospora]
MSTSSFKAQVKELEYELNEAEQHIDMLEQTQRQQIDGLQVEYKTRLEGASGDLFRFIKCIWESDTRLLKEHSDESKSGQLEGHLEEAADTIKSLNTTVEESFRGLEKHLTTSGQQLMEEQERATEEGTGRMGILSSKIVDTQTKIKHQISETEDEIEFSTKENSDAKVRKGQLHRDLNDMKRHLHQVAGSQDTECTLNGFSMWILGIGFCTICPPVGLSIMAAGAISLVMRAANKGIANTTEKINKLKERIRCLGATLRRLKTDLRVFDTLMGKVQRLNEKSSTLHQAAHKHVQAIIAAKDLISIGGRKIVELNVHMRLGYVDTREDLADTLKTIVEKLGQGRLQLEGKMDSPEAGEMLAMVGDIAENTDEVLAIMDRV